MSRIDSLVYDLADLAEGTCLRVWLSETGGFDQWVMARMAEARRDYIALCGGNPSLGVMRRRWSKVEAFIRANRARMDKAKGQWFTDEVVRMVSNIIRSIDLVRFVEPFDPLCPNCGVDTVLVEPLHRCRGMM